MKKKADHDTFPFGQAIAWTPNTEWIRDSNLQHFMDKLNLDSLESLQRKSEQQPAWFWDEAIKDLEIEFATPYSTVLDVSGGIELPSWCVGGRMNIVSNCIDKWLDTDVATSTAFVWESEDGSVVSLSYQELNAHVCQCANAMRELGLGEGDAVGLLMPMTLNLVVAFLATAKIGGVILPLFSGYGPQAISTRLSGGNAKAVFTSDGFFRREKYVNLKSTLDRALEECPSVEHVIVSSSGAKSRPEMVSDRDVLWNDIVPNQADTAETLDVSAESIVMIIYTSGTTGEPKGAVHTHCGFPIKAAQDMRHAMDLKRGEMMYWMTDMGWMMGPWLVFGTLLNGSGMLFYDGAPDFPDEGRLWRIVEHHRVTHLGLSPVLIRALMSKGTEHLERADFSRLRAVCSTGSPWDPESWWWVFQNVLDSQKPILNYSGGTEISGGIVCGNFFSPLKPCAFSGAVPGMAADVVDESGASVRGAVGELVIRAPWIGMTRGFWNDKERYLQTYWQRHPGIWVHGDFAAIDSDGLWYILGRSDDTIKIAGKRVGPAEVESIVNSHPKIRESAAIGAPHVIKGEQLVIYCVAEEAEHNIEVLRDQVVALVVDELGKPLKPGAILFTTSLPKTRNAKVMRRLIRAVHLDQSYGDTSSLEDPATLDAIRSAK